MSYETHAAIRDAQGLNDHRVAKMAEIEYATINNWKRGLYTPKEENRRKIADALGVSLEYLDTGDLDKETRERVYESRPVVRKLFSIAQGLPDEEVEKMIKIFEIQYGIKPDEDE